MFTVECPGCSASYQVDERRVPAGGLRMRCPKCSTAFVVEKPSAGQPASGDANLPAQVQPPKTTAAVKPTMGAGGKPAPPPLVRPAAPSATAQAPKVGGPPGPPPRGTNTSAVTPNGPAPNMPAPRHLPPRQAPAAKPTLADPKPPAPLVARGAVEADLPVATAARNPPLAPQAVARKQANDEAMLPEILPRLREPAKASSAAERTGGPIAEQPGTDPAGDKSLAFGALPAIRSAPTERDLLPSRAVGGYELDVRATDDLPARRAATAAQTDPMLPAAHPHRDFDSDGELPAALGSKPAAVPTTAARPTDSVRRVDADDVPQFRSGRTYTQPDFDNVDLALPEISRQDIVPQSAHLPDIAARRRFSPSGIELDLPSPHGPTVSSARPHTSSIPPMVDDFEFELPSPAQARQSLIDAELPANRGGPPGVGDHRNVPQTAIAAPTSRAAAQHELGYLPALDVGLPEVGTPQIGLPDVGHGNVGGIGLPERGHPSVGLPQVPGSPSASTKTLSGPGSQFPIPRATAVGNHSVPPAEIPELDLGWGASASAPPAGSPSVPPLGSLPPALGFGAQAAGSLPPALGRSPASPGIASAHQTLSGLSEPTGNSLPPAFGIANQPANIAYRQEGFSRFDSDHEMELPVDSKGLGARRSTGSIPPTSPIESSSRVATAGSTSYGEVTLDSTEEMLSVDTDAASARQSLNSSEVLEFGGLPQSDGNARPSAVNTEAAASAPVSLQRGTSTGPRASTAKRGKSRKILLGGLAVAVMGGAALSLLPDVGLFGSHFIVDQLRAKENLALVAREASSGNAVLQRDDFSGVESIVAELQRLRREHGRVRSLSAYFSYLSYAFELRHGPQPGFHGAAEVALNELKDRPELPYWGLAQAARAAADGNLARARHDIDRELSIQPRNVEVVAISAEIALLERRANDALQQWQQAEKVQASARTAFGLARAFSALGQNADASAFAKKALERNANHVGAELLLARLALDGSQDTLEAERLIQSALHRSTVSSVRDFVQAKTLSGDAHLLHSRISLAETSYQEALEKDQKAASALRGLGETLYRAGRYSESLARFEAGLQADPDNLDAAVGAAKAQLALERIRDALTLLTRLRQANGKSYAVNYWYARANEAGGNRDEAEKAYGAAIEAGGTNPIVVDAYVGLALVKNQQGRPEEAQKVLADAQAKLPKMPKIHEALGQLALAEGRYDAAVVQFKEAIKLDPTDVGVKFRLGVAHRKNREFEAAAKCFDDVAAVDRDYPGLALERGQLFESSGQTEEALRAFESALAKAPTDPDLMLRVGCGKVAAGRPEQAEQLLKKVLEQRPTSAETHHCLGRAQLLEGSNLALALRTLERAVELDPHRAEYHLYVGWAANEAGRVAEAEQELKKALELDQGLGDAYWQRGILRYRQGAIKDAVTDLARALELRPGRYEAHAALADAYFDLGLEAKALEQWALATTAQPDNATWAFRYGKLLQGAHRDAEAKTQLDKSIELAEKLPAKPRWIWEAHHLMARALGHQPAAVKHWRAFLELAPRDNVYREEAKTALQKLGQPWDGD